MASRTVNLSPDAYARLAGLKKEGESFSDVVNRLTGKYALLGLVGVFDKKQAEQLRRASRAVSRRLGRSVRRRG